MINDTEFEKLETYEYLEEFFSKNPIQTIIINRCYISQCYGRGVVKIKRIIALNTEVEILACLMHVSELPFGQKILDAIIPHNGDKGCIEIQKREPYQIKHDFSIEPPIK